MLTRALLARGHEVLSLEDEAVRIRRRDGTEASLGLANLRRILEAAPPGEAAAHLSRHLDALETAPAAAGEAAPEGPLVPRLLLEGGPEQPWSRPLVPGVLNLALAVDLPRAVRFVTPLDLLRWELSVAEAEARARSELARRTAGVHPDAAGLGEVLQVHVGDSLDAARLLIAHELFGGPGGALAVIPGRDGLFGVPVGTEAPVEEARQLLALAQHFVRRVPYPLTSRLFWVHRGTIREVEVGSDARGELVFAWPAALATWLGQGP